jgi:hypothetical protein
MDSFVFQEKGASSQKSAFACFPLIRRAEVEGQHRVDTGRID